MMKSLRVLGIAALGAIAFGLVSCSAGGEDDNDTVNAGKNLKSSYATAEEVGSGQKYFVIDPAKNGYASIQITPTETYGQTSSRTTGVATVLFEMRATYANVEFTYETEGGSVDEPPTGARLSLAFGNCTLVSSKGTSANWWSDNMFMDDPEQLPASNMGFTLLLTTDTQGCVAHEEWLNGVIPNDMFPADTSEVAPGFRYMAVEGNERVARKYAYYNWVRGFFDGSYWCRSRW